MPVKPSIAIALSLIFLTACNNSDSKTESDFLASNIDTTVKASDDFFKYANGQWIKNNPIPPAESGWGVGDLVQEEIFIRLQNINESALKENSPEGTITQKIADFWFSGMDSTAINKNGLNPLHEDLNKINQVTNSNGIIDLAAEFHKKGVNILFNSYVAQDDKNSDVMAYKIAENGRGPHLF